MNLLTSLLFAALLMPQAPPLPAPPPRPELPSVAAPAQYTIGPQDLLKITVFDEPDLTNSYRVDGDGFITFPYISRVAAGGLKLGELQDRIRALLSAGFIRNPQVRVEIGEFKSQSVLVSGEVPPGKSHDRFGDAAQARRRPARRRHRSSERGRASKRSAGTPTSSDQLWKDRSAGAISAQDGDIIKRSQAQTFHHRPVLLAAAMCSSPAPRCSRRSPWPAVSPSAVRIAALP